MYSKTKSFIGDKAVRSEIKPTVESGVTQNRVDARPLPAPPQNKKGVASHTSASSQPL